MIIEPDIKEKLEQLNNTPYGIAIKVYLGKAREEINDVKTMSTFDELLGRKYALKYIDELFSFMGEKKVETRSKNQYT